MSVWPAKRVIVTVILSFFLVGFVSAQEQDQDMSRVLGKVFDSDKKTELKNVPVHIVNLETGEATDTKTNSGGCYKYTDVKPGTYSLTVSHDGKDYLLPDRLHVVVPEKKTAIVTCLALLENTTELQLVEKC